MIIYFKNTLYVQYEMYPESKDASPVKMQGFFFRNGSFAVRDMNRMTSRVHRPQSRQRCARIVCLKWPCRLKIPQNVRFVQ
jgi:hypothetical protein